MKLIIAIALMLPLFASSQIPKGARQVLVKGVTFREVADSLLDNGYQFDKIDSNFLTIKTQARNGFVMFARVKDSVCVLTGEYNENPLSNDGGIDGQFFKAVNLFAASFKKPIEYKK